MEMMKIQVLALLTVTLCAVLCSAREKGGMSMLPYHVPTYNYPPMPSYANDYAPVYYGNVYPEYKKYKKYMPYTDYEYVKSVPFIGPTIAFYPKMHQMQSYGGGGGGYY